MGQILAVISGKGGTGKTTVCAALAACLAKSGQRVLCIDADIGLRNLDIALGMSDLAIIPFTEVYRGRYALSDATPHPSIANLSLLTAPIRVTQQDISFPAFGILLEQVRKEYDWCLIDAPAGLGLGFDLATRFADRVLAVSTPDPAAMRDVTHTAEILSTKRNYDIRLVVNRVTPKIFSRMHLTVDDMMDATGLPLLGIVPEDPNVILAASANKSLVERHEKGAGLACKNIASRLCGKRTPLMKLH